MNIHVHPTDSPEAHGLDDIIKLAIMAVGGQGGGVLTGWIEDLARTEGYACQATSVAGVAQRTGATIYYVEMAPASSNQPVFSLAPSSGDVDILIAAEMMEAGRAIMRGFVTPNRTTLIASSHRSLAVSEKMVPGDGIANAAEVAAAAEIAAERLICFDMEKLALENDSVISATLFGALAGSAALPFDRSAFECAIKRGGKGVEASLRSFEAAFDKTKKEADFTTTIGHRRPALTSNTAISGSRKQKQRFSELSSKLTALPSAVQTMAPPGLEKVVEFMDVAYGREYLARLQQFVSLDDAEREWELSTAAAKYISNAMAYDDVIRVADLKTRAARNARIQKEMNAGEERMLQITEFFHPRAEEIIGLMPKRLGEKWDANPKTVKRIDRWFNRGRRLRSDRLRHFIPLYLIGGLKAYRRRTYRHALEQQHLDNWTSHALEVAKSDYSLAVEILKCRRLIKGYSDTHARGLSKFDKAMSAARMLEGREDAAKWLARVREAALSEEAGDALDGAIKTIQSFVDNP